MSTIREKLLQAIYRQFATWLESQPLPLACQKGCATCCTQNVTITAVEGDLIHQHINDNGLSDWFAGRLMERSAGQKLTETTNDFAEKCLAGEATEGHIPHAGQDALHPDPDTVAARGSRS